MIFLGYNFLQDRYSWQPVPTNLVNITDIKIENGIYDRFNITKDIEFPYITTEPGDWDLETQLDANFNGDINAGNISYVVSQISNIQVKRRKKGEFDWHTLYNVPVTDVTDINFVRNDYLAKNETEYEYAIVPIIGNVEGEYSINSIESKFYGVFLTDGENSFKFKENVSYTGNEKIHLTATYQPFGSKYPIIISNGNLSYEKGTVNGEVVVIDNNYELDRKLTVERLNLLKEFLRNPNAKILKDFNGNIWLVTLTDNVPINYHPEVGMGFAQVSFNWVEIGDSNSGKDLYDNNLIYSEN